MTIKRHYHPQRNRLKNIGKSFGFILFDLWDSRRLGLKFFKRDFLVRYRQSFLGITWALLMPILTVGIFVLISNSGIIQVGQLEIPYAVYAFYGLATYQLFSALLITVSSVAPSSKSLMSTVYMPRFSHVYSPLLMALTDYVIRMLFLFILIAFTKTPINMLLILAWLPTLLPLIFLGLGIGLFMTIMTGITRDMTNVIHIGLQFLMFLSPVIYPVRDQAGVFGLITNLNPLTHLLDFSRDVFFGLEFGQWQNFTVVGILCSVFFVLCLRFYFVSIERTLEVI